MPIVRTEYNFRRSHETASTAIDITSYDLVGRFTTDSEVTTCGSGEDPQFIFADDAPLAGDSVAVVWRGKGGRMALRLYGSGSAGQKLKSDGSGRIIASATAETAAPAAGDFGIARENWSAVANTWTECEVF